MSRKVQGIVTLVLVAGNAGLWEVLGAALGASGINIESFIKDFNAATSSGYLPPFLRVCLKAIGS